MAAELSTESPTKSPAQSPSRRGTITASSVPPVADATIGFAGIDEPPDHFAGAQGQISRKGYKKQKWLMGGLGCLMLIAAAIAVPLVIMPTLGVQGQEPETPIIQTTPMPIQSSSTSSTIQKSFALAMAKSSFTPDRQNKFRGALAAAAAVAITDVTIDKIEAMTSARRRHLLEESVRVDTSIKVADASAASALETSLTASTLNSELDKVGLPAATILDDPAETTSCPANSVSPAGLCGLFA